MIKKKSRKKPITPRSKVRQALRMLSLRSRERAECLKKSGYRCEMCGVKQSKAKGKEAFLEVHHINGSGINEIIDLIFEKLLCDSKYLQSLCVDCHSAITSEEKQAKAQGCEI
jgi:predicted HNH restriction endonuclease